MSPGHLSVIAPGLISYDVSPTGLWAHRNRKYTAVSRIWRHRVPIIAELLWIAEHSLNYRAAAEDLIRAGIACRVSRNVA